MTISTLPETSFTYDEVAALMREAFAQWGNAGLDSFLVHAQPEVIRKRTSSSTVYVAYEEDVLLGTISMDIIPDRQGSHAFLKFLAIHPSGKGQGLASKLCARAVEDAEKAGCQYMLSDTSTAAPWAVRWHLKMGFRKIGYASFSTNHYYSYRFRRELGGRHEPPVVLTWFQFVRSWLKVKLTKKKDGSPTAFYRLSRRFVG